MPSTDVVPSGQLDPDWWFIRTGGGPNLPGDLYRIQQGKTPPGTLCQLALEAVGQFSQHLFRAWTPQFVRNAKDDPSIQQRADTMFALIRIYYFIDVAKVPARQVPRASRDN